MQPADYDLARVSPAGDLVNQDTKGHTAEGIHDRIHLPNSHPNRSARRLPVRLLRPSCRPYLSDHPSCRPSSSSHLWRWCRLWRSFRRSSSSRRSMSCRPNRRLFHHSAGKYWTLQSPKSRVNRHRCRLCCLSRSLRRRVRPSKVRCEALRYTRQAHIDARFKLQSPIRCSQNWLRNFQTSAGPQLLDSLPLSG